MRTVLVRGVVLFLGSSLALGGAACGGGARTETSTQASVVVTTSVLGDVVANLVGDAVTTIVVMPAGSDPHDFAPSPRHVEAIRDAGVLVVNGLGQEASLLDTIDAAERDGTTIIRASDGVEAIGDDPHFVIDPVRMRSAASHVADELARHVEGLDTPAFRARVQTYLSALDDLDREIVSLLEPVPAERRVLVTYHQVLGYFAERYGFTILGSVVTGASPLAEASAADLSALAERMARDGVSAVFTEQSSPDRLARALAAEGTGIAVVELYTESLGPAGSDGSTYLGMMRANAERIAAALA